MNADQIVAKIKQFKEIAREKVLKAMQIEADKSVQLNFQAGGRPDKWKEKLFPDGRNVLVGKSNALQKRTTSKINFAAGIVTIGNTLVYGKIHNEGGKIMKTPKMRGFFFHKFEETKNEIWLKMALSKKDYIEIPKREYLNVPEADYPRILNNCAKVINSITI